MRAQILGVVGGRVIQCRARLDTWLDMASDISIHQKGTLDTFCLAF